MEDNLDMGMKGLGGNDEFELEDGFKQNMADSGSSKYSNVENPESDEEDFAKQ